MARICCIHMASRPLIGPEPTLSGLVNSYTITHAKFEID